MPQYTKAKLYNLFLYCFTVVVQHVGSGPIPLDLSVYLSELSIKDIADGDSHTVSVLITADSSSNNHNA